MSTSLQRKHEKLIQLLERLATEATKGALIVVEGKNDVKALKKLAIEGNIISVKTAGKSFVDALAQIEEENIKEAILLLDFDRRGREWTKRLRQHLEEQRIKVNVNLWNKLRSLLGRDVKDVEGLPAYIETLKKRIGN
jgi:2,5-diamino-6-(ribosylamino)-4(3H)-pyrimidinone 5'-phosphate reductase